MEHYLESLQRAAILEDFTRQLRLALRNDEAGTGGVVADRYFAQYPWLAEAFYRNVYLRGRRRALEARVRTYDRLIARHNPKIVRYLSEEWRHQRDDTVTELRELEGLGTLEAPPWAQIVQQFRAQLPVTADREAE